MRYDINSLKLFMVINNHYIKEEVYILFQIVINELVRIKFIKI
jgi:hypothetical protein